MTALANSASATHARLEVIARIFAILTAMSLPWSSSATGICIGIWAVALLPTIEWRSFRLTSRAPAACIPAALVALALAGTLWADVTWPERLHGLAPFTKLLVIPLLMWQFCTWEKGEQVLFAFFISACVLLLTAWIFILAPNLFWSMGAKTYGVPVKDYISQSGIFTLCIFGLLERAISVWHRSRRNAILMAALACAFFANIVFVALARTSLIVIAVLFVLLGLLRLSRRGFAILMVTGTLIAALSWNASGYLRDRVTHVATELNTFSPDHDTSSGARLSFWNDSLEIVRDAPWFGHGTGSIREMFSRQTGQDMTAPGAASNPHNQVFAVAIQLGAAGVLIMIMMWFAHVGLFLTRDAVSWIGLMVVVQNIVSSMFNSHLFDFTQGWIYVLGVGVTGGLILRSRACVTPEKPASTVVS